ncbi:MAG: tetratricopeptide repeat protein [Terriglobia bacterium]
MPQPCGFTNWYAVLCACVVWLALDPVAWAQVPNETYDFSIAKGMVEFGRGHYEQAAHHFEQARQAMPNDPEATEYLGQTLLHLKKYREAEALFHDLTVSHPTRAQPWLGLAISQSQLGKYREALSSLEQARKLDPQNPLVYFYQGVVLHELKAFNQSPALFSRAMALSPDLTPTARYYTGMSYYERGLLDQAQKEFEAASGKKLSSRRTRAPRSRRKASLSEKRLSKNGRISRNSEDSSGLLEVPWASVRRGCSSHLVDRKADEKSCPLA